jgi:DNA mismatch repair protein MutS
MKLVEEYLKKHKEYICQYGVSTVLLMQVGAFYEIYSLNDSSTSSYKVIYEISKICDLVVTEKTICVGKIPILGSGFRDYSIDKYIKKIQNNGYTSVVYSQDNNCKNTTRSLTGIYTPSTFIDDNIQEFQSNNITCLWIEKIKNELHIGISNINIIDGISHIFEYNTPYLNIPSVYDNIEKYISVYNPKETIIIHNLSDKEIDNMIQYTNIYSLTIRKVDLKDKYNNNTIYANKCTQQTYQQSLLNKFFEINDIASFMDQFLYNQFACQSYCYLLNFLHTINSYLVKKISTPKFDNITDRLILANHSLIQLNITSNENKKKHSSILQLMDNTVTAMGKRMFSNVFLNPITDILILENRYNLTENLINNIALYTIIRHELMQIKDLDKICKLILMKNLSPKSLFFLHSNLNQISLLYEKISKEEFLKNEYNKSISELSLPVIKYIDENINLSKIENLFTIDDNLFLNGIYPELDKMEKDYMESKDKLDTIVNYLNEIMENSQKPKKPTVYVKLHPTEKSGYTLQITKTRSKILEDLLKNKENVELNFISSYSNEKERFTLELSTIKIIQIQNTVQITSPYIETLIKMNLQYKSKIREYTNEKYQEFLLQMVNYIEYLHNISEFIGKIDILQNSVYIATKYNYCKPQIIESDKSFINAKGLRHCLIECIQKEEGYVPNDVNIGNENPSMLIFGTNAVGKTCYMKSIGISQIMAQSGLFVPATSYIYSPYKTIFTRILNNDNMFKGLSTFTLEMSEMSNILKYSDKNSLVLGDELCSGTELRSALCIFISGLTHLHKVDASFIFTTHFHELLEYNEIKSLKNLVVKHMQVSYDIENNALVYDRLLKDGPGDNTYGLEVCKSLHLPDEFLSNAFNVLHKYFPEYKSPLELSKSKYNSLKLKDMCEVCNKKMGSEIHHLQFQQNAMNNYVHGSHKNHKSNLINICESCHDELHIQNKEMIKKKTTNGYMLCNK